MRTLKKALSLVLVLAMVFTLAVPALAVDKATEFKDYDKVENKEAVDVLTAVGVLNGNTDGTFGPEGNFTRAQAASIIAHMVLGSGADALTSAATGFSDVPANHWASGYIKYCYAYGIVAGKSSTVFAPNAPVTTVEAAKMLLVYSGVDAAQGGLTGAQWKANTMKLADQDGLLKGVEADIDAPLPRQYAAQMIYNELAYSL